MNGVKVSDIYVLCIVDTVSAAIVSWRTGPYWIQIYVCSLRSIYAASSDAQATTQNHSQREVQRKYNYSDGVFVDRKRLTEMGCIA